MVQWIVAYLSAAWLILQVVDVVGEQFAWPTVLERVITVALAAGFLPAAVVAWYHGEKGHQRVTRTEGILLTALVLLGAGAVVGTLGGAPPGIDEPGPAAGTVPVDPHRVAVLPFAPTGPDSALDRLGRDLAVTVSAALDGIDDLATVDGLSVLAHVPPDSSRVPLAEALAIAKRVGAGRLLRGVLSREGAGVRVDATLHDEHGEAVARATFTVPHGVGLPALSDSLVLGLVRQIWERPTAELPSAAALQTRSSEALRAYVEGEEAMARGRMVAAVSAFERAFAHDSTYWFAYWRSLYPRIYEGSQADPEIMQKVYAHRDRLPVADRLLVEAQEAPTLKARLPLLLEATRVAPTYWPAWYTLANAYVHHGSYLGATYRDARAALERVTALNPEHSGAWRHLLWIVVHQRDTTATRQVLDRLRTFVEPGNYQFDPDDEFYYGTTARAVLGGDSLPSAALSEAADYILGYTGPIPPYRFGIGLLIMGLPHTTIQLADSILARRPSPALTTSMWRGKAYAYAARGAWDAAAGAVDRWVATGGGWNDGLNGYGLLATGAALGAVDPGDAARRRPDRVPEDASPEQRAELAWLDGIIAYAAGDDVGLARARSRLRNTDGRFVPLLDRSLEALTLHRAGRRDDATAVLLAAEDSAATHYVPAQLRHVHPYIHTVDRVLLGRWLQDGGRPAEAARVLVWNAAVHPQSPLLEVVNRTVGLLGTYELARAEDAMGRRASAYAHYRRFLHDVDRPAPSLAPLVQHARDRVQALAPRLRG